MAPLTKVLFFRQLDILCNEEILGKDHTLKFVVVTRWRFKVRLCCDCVWFISELRSNSPPWDCQQCGCPGVISPRVAMGSAVPRPPLVSSLLIRVTDVLGREGPLQPERTLPATLPLCYFLYSYLRAFELAPLSAWNTLPTHILNACPLTFLRSLFKRHLIGMTFSGHLYKMVTAPPHFISILIVAI